MNGGGVYDTGSITISGTTIVGNQTTGDFRQGGGVYVGGPSSFLNLTNSTLSGNSATGTAAALVATSSNPDQSLQNDTIKPEHRELRRQLEWSRGGIDRRRASTINLRTRSSPGTRHEREGKQATQRQPERGHRHSSPRATTSSGRRPAAA